MSAEVAVDFLLLAMLLVVAVVQTWITLRRTRLWDFLGRALLLYFAGKALLWGYALAARLWGPFPIWLLWAVRVELIATSLLLLLAFLRYPWPAPPERIQWRGLLGLRERRAGPPGG